MYYTVYKITNKINGKIYIGKHQTNDLDDGYFGSGKVLKRAIKKHGIENFIKEYIEIFDNEEDMNVLESKLVNPTFVANSSTYNLKNGGEGGWDYIVNNRLLYCYSNPNKHKENYMIALRKGRQILKHKLQSNSIFKEEFSKKISNGCKGKQRFLGKTHSEETKKKIGIKNSKSQKGEKNSQFGTCWINNGTTNKKISKKDIDIWIEQGYNKGRIVKRKSSV